MQIVRTTLRLDKSLKKEAEKIALEEDTTLQNVVNLALDSFVEQKKKKAAKKKLKIISFNLGVPLDNLTRDDIYGEPDFEKFK